MTGSGEGREVAGDLEEDQQEGSVLQPTQQR